MTGQTIRAAREAKGYSLRTFARMAGISPTYLSFVERGLTRLAPARLRSITALLETGQVIDPNKLIFVSINNRKYVVTVKPTANVEAVEDALVKAALAQAKWLLDSTVERVEEVQPVESASA